MRQVARLIGIAWMVACVCLWVWVGFFWDWDPLDSFPRLSNWSVVALLQDNKLGLTFVPILLGGVGYAVYRWGTRGVSDPS